MASIIRIKRSTTAGDPTTLGSGEMAYSAADYGVVAGGGRLYIGSGSETGGNAASHIVIGGQYFTDMLDHSKGTLTASSALITDSNSKLDNLKVDNLDLNGNTLSSTNLNGNILITPDGTGKTIVSNLYVDATTSILEYIQEQSGGALVAGNGITIAVDTNANTTTITLSTEAVEDIVGGMVSSNTESGISVTYDDGNGKLNFDVNDPTITIAGDVDGSATMTNLGNTTITVALDTLLDGTTNKVPGTYGSTTEIPVVTVDAKGRVTSISTSTISTSFTLAGDTGTDTFNTGGTLTFTGSDAIDTVISNDTVTISAKDATSSQKGVASFSSTDFTVSGGAVSLNAESVQDIVGGMIVSNSESGIAVTYDDTNGKLDFNVDDFTITLGGDLTGSVTITNLANATLTATVAANSVALGTDTTGDYVASVGVTAGTGLSVSGTGEGATVTLSGIDATTTVKGVASFSSASFDVTSGAVSIKSGGVSNTQLVNSSVTFGSTTVALGSTSTSIAGVTELAVDNININGNTISSTNSNGNITLDPNGTGTVDVSGARITNLATPTQSSDAVTKAYVDAFQEGLHVHASVDAATTDSLATLTGGSVTYDNGTSGVGATITLGTALTTLDGYTLQNGDRILVKDEATASRNGIYTWATGGTVLTRATDFDSAVEIAGGDFTFVTNGTNYNNTGWVQTENVTTVGTDSVIFIQFSGAGTYLAGDGLSLTGSTFAVNVAATGGIEITSDALQLKSTVAGNGLTITNGVIDVVGTADRITVSSNAVDIASTYVGQATITTLGTITTGTWSATTIAVNKGGTGLTSYNVGDIIVANGATSLTTLAIGASGKVLQSNGTTLVYGDLDGGTY